jgi:hypothetical protein
MGKRARAKRHVEKMNAKRATKATRRAQYEALKGTGKNKKRKSGHSGNITVKPLALVIVVPVEAYGIIVLGERKVHGGPRCQNFGCKRCSSYWRDLVDKIEKG